MFFLDLRLEGLRRLFFLDPTLCKFLKYKLLFKIVLIIIALIIYFYFRDSGHKNLFNNYDLFYDDKIVLLDSSNLKQSKEGVQYSLSVWIQTNNLAANTAWYTSDDVPKTIINNSGSPNIMYLRRDNIIRFEIAYMNDNGLDYYHLDLPQFEVQQWINLILTVDNKKINVYKNGILEKSKRLENSNLTNYRMFTLGEKNNNFNGYIGRIDYYNYILDSDKIMSLYKKYKNKHPKNLMSYEQYKLLDSNKADEEMPLKELAIKLGKMIPNYR